MKFFDGLQKFASLICTVMFVLLTVITFGQAINRYLFNSSFFWAEEISRFMLVWLTFLGASIAALQDTHTKIDFFINLLPKKATIFMEILSDIICMAFTAVISASSINFIVISMKNLSPALKIPVGLVYFALPFSGILMLTIFAKNIFQRIIKLKRIEGGTM